MKRFTSWHLLIACKAIILSPIVIGQFTLPAYGQIIPDTSLGANPSVLVPENGTRNRIDGGVTQGTALFHSFQDFNIDPGNSVYFTNPADIETIFTRITGNNASELLGTLGVLGAADLFFLNPNGIIFGHGASLDLEGSFIASTANQIDFEDGLSFETVPTASVPLLNLSVPVGLSFDQPGPIVVQGELNANTGLVTSESSPTVLEVTAQRSLLLIGGDINLERGELISPSGRLEVGSVNKGEVQLQQIDLSADLDQGASGEDEIGWIADYTNVLEFNDVDLSSRSLLTADGSGGGTIQIQGARVSLTNNSVVSVRHETQQPTESITVRATEALDIVSSISDPPGFNPGFLGSVIINLTDGDVAGQPIVIETDRLFIDRGNIVSFALEEATGQGSDINIIATEVEIEGVFDPPGIPPNAAGVGTFTNGMGAGGDINVLTNRLTIRDGGAIGTQSLVGSLAKGGDISIVANDTIDLRGTVAQATFVSIIGTITSTSQSAGDLMLTARQLLVQEGAVVTSISGADGNTGTLTINASESILISGVALDKSGDAVIPISQNPSFISAAVPVLPDASQEVLEFPEKPSGDSGVLDLSTAELIIQEGAFLAVDNQGTGNAGELRVNADRIIIGSNDTNLPSGITAITTSGEGGDVRLVADDFLLFRNNGLISAEAGGSGNGGNIDINVGFIVAPLNSNNDIVANAFEGDGGTINIVARSILGLSEGLATPNNTTNDIDASSEFGISGTVTLNELVITPAQEVRNLSETMVNNAINYHCNPGQGTSNFVTTGRGGIPLGPEDAIASQDLWEDLYTPNTEITTTVELNTQSVDPEAVLTEAKGWVRNTDGNVELFATAEISAEAISTPVICSHQG